MRTALSCLLIGLFVAGCVTNRQPGEGIATQLERRNVQTRTYDVADTRLVMKALVNVLQDLGYVIKSADTDLGLLNAEKWTDVPHSRRELKKAEKKGQPLAKTQMFECTANVTQTGEQCRVRLTFQRRVLDLEGAVIHASMIDEPEFYQRFFSQVSKSVFLQQEGV